MTAQTILLLAALGVVLLVGARWGIGNRRVPAALQPLLSTGTVFIFIGALTGPQGLNLFTQRTMVQLGPVLVIALGWIGFLFGAHLEWRRMRRYPASLYAAGSGQALLTFALVVAAGTVLLRLWVGAVPTLHELLAEAAILGICAMGTAPAGVFHFASRQRLSVGDLNAVQFFSAVDDLPAMILLGLMGAFLHPALNGVFTLAGLVWLALSVGLGLGLGVVTHWLFHHGEDVRVNTLILLGIVALGGGAAALLRLSPLFVMTLSGVVFANISPRKETAYGLLVEHEHVLYAVFLFVGGTLFSFDWTAIALFVPVYVLLRAAGKLGGTWLASRTFLRRERLHPLLGASMLFQGGMSLAMAISFERTHDSELAHQITTTIVLAIVVNELLGPLLAERVLGGGARS